MTSAIHDASAASADQPGFSGLIARDPDLTDFVKQAGLEPLAKAVEGENFVVCDLTLHRVQGCADMREGARHQQMVAECAAIGLAVMVAVIVGSIGVAFVDLITKYAAPLGRNRVYALFPKRSGRPPAPGRQPS